MTLSKTQNLISWALQIVVAVILFQTLFFKFTGAEESKYIFTTLGIEPWGRIGSGVVELIAVVLLFIPATITYGAILAMGATGVAILSHLTKLGIAVQNSDGTSDGGFLFILAVVTFISSIIILLIRRAQIPVFGKWLSGAHA